jgi:hypothetical protein
VVELTFGEDQLERLAQLLAAELAGSTSTPTSPNAYTATTLARELEVTPRAIRAAIARGDLDATKRNGRWLIASTAVHKWASAGAHEGRRRHAQRRRTQTPGTQKSSLREALLRGEE